MDRSIQKKLFQVRMRHGLGRFLECLQLSLLITGAVLIAAVVAQRGFAFELISLTTILTLLGGGMVVALIHWWMTQPAAMQLAVMLDERAGLRERLSSSLAFEDLDDPFACAALKESRDAVAAVQPADHFPLHLPAKSWLSLSVWVLAGLLFYLLPQGDLLDKLAAREAQQQRDEEIKTAQAAVLASLNKVNSLSKVLDQDALGQPAGNTTQQITAARDPEEARSVAVRQIKDLQDRLAQSRANPKYAGLEYLQEKLRQIRTPYSGPARLFGKHLAKGDFGEAVKSLRALQEQLQRQEMSEEQRKQLSEQLANMAEQLKKLSEQQWKLKNELKQAGLDPELANNLEELKKALQESKLTEEQKQKLKQAAQANQQACQAAGGLCKSLSAASASMSSGSGQGGRAAGLSQAADQLSQLESLRQQLQLADAAIDELQQAAQDLWQGGQCSACKDQGQCNVCGGGVSSWAPGQSNKHGNGMGGRGIGRGGIAPVEEDKTNSLKTRVKGETEEAPIIASWYIQDQQIRGESRKQFAQEVATAEQETAEAINEQRIPREYHGPVKKYFGSLREISGAAEPAATGSSESQGGV